FKTEQRLREDLFSREAAQHLIEVANLHAATGEGSSLTAMLAFAPQSLGFIEMLRGDRNVFSQSVGKQCFAELRQVVVPRNLLRNGDGMAERRRLHDFEILLILRSSPRGHLVDPLADVVFACAAELGEGVEEVVVATDSRVRYEGPHGERVDQ